MMKMMLSQLGSHPGAQAGKQAVPRLTRSRGLRRRRRSRGRRIKSSRKCGATREGEKFEIQFIAPAFFSATFSPLLSSSHEGAASVADTSLARY